MKRRLKPHRPVNPLLAWRKRNDLSQRKAAIALGCARVSWMKWERSVRGPPKYIHLAMLAIEHGLAEAAE